MKSINLSYMGQTRWWWAVLVLGILLILGGVAYWLWPVEGFVTAAILFGWLLILAGIVQLCVAAGPDHPKGWGWWIAGGVIDLFVGFVLVRNLGLSEAVLPLFLAVVFIFWGIEAFVGAAMHTRYRYWWLGLINGILLCLIGFFFLEGSIVNNVFMVSFLTAIAFIYWGFSIAMVGYEMKPIKQ